MKVKFLGIRAAQNRYLDTGFETVLEELKVKGLEDADPKMMCLRNLIQNNYR